MNLTPEQFAILGQIMAIPGAADLIESIIIGHLMQKFQEDIDNDPTIEDAEQVYEILGRGAGYMHDLVETAKSVLGGQTNGS